jgi:hypothetical protein
LAKPITSKSFLTWFFPVGDDLVQILADWVAYLRKEKLRGLDDPQPLMLILSEHLILTIPDDKN